MMTVPFVTRRKSYRVVCVSRRFRLRIDPTSSLAISRPRRRLSSDDGWYSKSMYRGNSIRRATARVPLAFDISSATCRPNAAAVSGNDVVNAPIADIVPRVICAASSTDALITKVCPVAALAHPRTVTNRLVTFPAGPALPYRDDVNVPVAAVVGGTPHRGWPLTAM